jgi:hypothetical protein
MIMGTISELHRSLYGPEGSRGLTTVGPARTAQTWPLLVATKCFPRRESGGFLCVIDRLELLQTSKAARALPEAIRDTALNLPGLHWVLCGAKGIVPTCASSPRLEGTPDSSTRRPSSRRRSPLTP